MAKHQNIKIVKNEEKPETPELLAASLIAISDAMTKLSGKGNLENKAIALLVKSMPYCSHLKLEEINLVLENLPKLKSYYIRK